MTSEQDVLRVDEAPHAVQPAQPDAGAVLSMIERAARDPAIDLDKFERLMAMRERIEDREASRAFNEAMAAAQGEMGPISRDAGNKQTNSRYATFAALDEVCRPIYSKYGFRISYNTEPGPGDLEITIIAKVTHGGYAETYQITMPADGKGAKGGDVMTKTHATVSAVSYGKRALLKMIWNLAEIDDDGNKAGDNGARVTPDQLAELREALDATQSDIAAFCRFAKIEAMSDLPASKFAAAMSRLREKAAKMGAK